MHNQNLLFGAVIIAFGAVFVGLTVASAPNEVQASEESCVAYAVMLEPNSGPMPGEITPPRLLEPPRFLCNAETKMEAYPGGLIVCRCF